MTSDSPNPEISVLMAVHNGEPYLSLAIESVLSQTFDNFELVIVNDGSTDASPDTIRRFQDTDPRVRFINNEKNLGLVASLNRGLTECRADLVARADADDIFRPDRLQKQFTYLNDHPKVGVLGTAVEFIDPDGNLVDRHLNDFPTSPEDVRLHSLLGCCLWHTTVMFRRQPVEKAGGYSMDFVGGPEDYDLWTRLFEQVEIANLPDVLAQQRIHSASITAGWNVGYAMFCSVAQRLITRYLNRDVSESEATAFVSLCGCDGDLTSVDLNEGFQLLREVLKQARQKESPDVFRKFRDRCTAGLMRQAATSVYSHRGRSLKLMTEACRSSPSTAATSSVWMNLLRVMTPGAIRSGLKQLRPGGA